MIEDESAGLDARSGFFQVRNNYKPLYKFVKVNSRYRAVDA